MKFIDVSPDPGLRERIDCAISSVIDKGHFILGPEVSRFEQLLSDYTGAMHAVSCANGTDALTLAMMSESIGPGDAVVCPSFTFVATGEAVAQLGGTPVFADVDPETFLLSPASAASAIEEAKKLGLRVRAIIAVDLFGAPADYVSLKALCQSNDLVLIADAAQSFSAATPKGKVGTLADYTTLSFFPTKPLGCYGDGGAVLTDNHDKASVLKSLRFHGKGDHKYNNVRVGVNSRLDTLQAAILLEKLPHVDRDRRKRAVIAEQYVNRIGGIVACQRIADGDVSAFAQFTVCLPRGRDRSDVMIYYPVPLHRQEAYNDYPCSPDGLAVSEMLSSSVLSLPLHSKLTESDCALIADAFESSVTRVIA